MKNLEDALLFLEGFLVRNLPSGKGLRLLRELENNCEFLRELF